MNPSPEIKNIIVKFPKFLDEEQSDEIKEIKQQKYDLS